MAALDDPAIGTASVADLYRGLWKARRELIRRYHLDIAFEIGLIAAWFAIRTVFGDESRVYVLWTVLAAATAVVSPTSGLVVLIATMPFFEPVSLSRALGPRHILVVVLALSLVARLAIGGWRTMPRSPAIFMAGILGIVAAVGVLVTSSRYPGDWTTHAAQMWLASVGGAMILLLVSVWVARDGALRPLVAAVAAVTIAAALSVGEHFASGSVTGSPIAWIGYWKEFNGRLTGVIASPNALAALFVMPTAILGAALVLGKGWRLRLASAVGLVPLVIGMYVTYSRAALLAMFVLAVIIAWRIRRALGAVLLVVGVVAGLALLPSYLQLRSQSALEGAVAPGSLIVASDLDRLRAWETAVAMFRDQPLTGQGFLAYKPLADAFGDPVLGSPHNEWLRLLAEEGLAGGLAAVAFVGATLFALARRRGWLATGIFAGFLGYTTMATFNNPFLFIQVSAVVFAAVGYGLAQAAREPGSSPWALRAVGRFGLPIRRGATSRSDGP